MIKQRTTGLLGKKDQFYKIAVLITGTSKYYFQLKQIYHHFLIRTQLQWKIKGIYHSSVNYKISCVTIMYYKREVQNLNLIIHKLKRAKGFPSSHRICIEIPQCLLTQSYIFFFKMNSTEEIVGNSSITEPKVHGFFVETQKTLASNMDHSQFISSNSAFLSVQMGHWYFRDSGKHSRLTLTKFALPSLLV